MAFFDSALWQTDDAAAEEARRRAMAPPVIAGLTPDGVNPVVSSGYREGVSPKYGVPEQLMGPAPVPPDDASRHPAVVKMLSLPRLRTAPTPDAVTGLVSEAGDREGVTPGYGLPTPTAEYLGAGVPIPGGPPVIAGPTLDEVAGLAGGSDPQQRYAANVAKRLETEGHAALARAGADPAQYQIPDLNLGGPAVYHPAKGLLKKIGQHVLGGLEGLGAGLATGHPLAGAVMGVAGGVNPQLANNAWFNSVTLPHREAQLANQLDLAGRRLGILAKIGEITGTNPVTGEPTPAYRIGQERIDAINARNDAYQAATERRLQQADERIEQSGKRVTDAETNSRIHNILAFSRIPGRTIDGAAREFIQKTTGITLPEKYDPTRDFLVQDESGKWQLIQIDKGSGDMKTTATGVQSPSRIARRTSAKGVRTRQGPEATLTAEEGQQRYNASARVIQERDDLTDTQKAKMIRKLKTRYGIR